MKLARKDLKQLAVPAVGLLALLLSAWACYAFSTRYLQESKTLGVAITAQRTEVQGKLARATEEEREIKENLQQYQALVARGIIGEEKRLDWVDTITAIKNERRIFNINYSLEPQKPFELSGTTRGSGGVEFVSSRLRLELQLLHEDDLLNFFDDLTKRSKAHVLARNCRVSRLARPERGNAALTLTPRLQVTCLFEMITIHHH
jgi:hypothetical protein